MNTDWSSRILSLASLLISLGGVGYLVTQDRVSRSKEDLVAQFKTELQKQVDDYQKERNELEKSYQASLDLRDRRYEEWNSKLNESLTKFSTDAESLLTQIDERESKASDERRTAFRRQLANLTETDAGNTTGADEANETPEAKAGEETAGPLLNQPKPEVDGDQEVAAGDSANPEVQGPLLQLANSTFRPTSFETMLITLRNDTDQEALIDRIRFLPEREFRAPASVTRPTSNVAGSIETISFSLSDNTSERTGFHGIYERRLTTPLRIPPRGSASLRVVIDDKRHEGWGLAGQLAIEYNSPNKKPLEVNEAHVVFQD